MIEASGKTWIIQVGAEQLVKKLANRRVQTKRTQKDVASVVEVSQSVISRYEQGLNKSFDLVLLAAWCEALGVVFSFEATI